MSRAEEGSAGPTSSGVVFDVQAQALAMISFISNRLVAGAASPIREFAGLSVNEAGMMLLINGGAVKTAAEAARLIGVDQAAISRSVQRLIERGFVVSTPDQKHAKRNLLQLTVEGKSYANALWRLNEEREDRLLSVLTTAERAFFLDILARVLGNVEAANEVRPKRTWLGE